VTGWVQKILGHEIGAGAAQDTEKVRNERPTLNGFGALSVGLTMQNTNTPITVAGHSLPACLAGSRLSADLTDKLGRRRSGGDRMRRRG
jgi:hypothetical protein